MAMDSKSLSDPAPWFTLKRLLVVFCMINMFNYVDRGEIASNGVNGSPRTCTESNGDFDLTNFKYGVISYAFMVGLLVASPIFPSLAKSINSFGLIGVGLSEWAIAAAGCGLSVDFWSITFCRMLVGVGEASFISLAALFIDDNAPPIQRTTWLNVFYMCIPTRVALGYVYGGLVGSGFGWRYAFSVRRFNASICYFGFCNETFSFQMTGMSNAKTTPGSLNEESSNKDFSYVSYIYFKSIIKIFARYKGSFARENMRCKCSRLYSV